MVLQHVYHLSMADKIGMVTSCWRQLQTFSTMQLLVRLEDQTLCKPPREAMAACHHEDYRLQSVQPNVSVLRFFNPGARQQIATALWGFLTVNCFAALSAAHLVVRAVCREVSKGSAGHGLQPSLGFRSDDPCTASCWRQRAYVCYTSGKD